MRYMDKSIEELHELLIKGEVTSDELVKESLELIKKFERINAKEENLPNIVTTLFSKIDNCDFFVADVSLCYLNQTHKRKC